MGARQLVPDARGRGRRLLLPALPERQDRAHAPLLARPAQDAEDHRRRQGEDGRLRRHGAGAQGDDLREGPVAADPHLRGVADAHRRHLQPEDRERRAAAARMPALPLASWQARATRRRSPRTAWRSSACSSSCRPRSSQPLHDGDREDRDRLPGNGDRRRLQDPRLRRRREAADALATLDGQARGAAAARARGRHDRLDRGSRLRRHDGRRARDRRRPGLRPRALHDRRRRRARPRVARRERHLRRRAARRSRRTRTSPPIRCSRTTSSSRRA